MAMTIDETSNQNKNLSSSTQNETTKNNSSFLNDLENTLRDKIKDENGVQEQINGNNELINIMKNEIEELSKDRAYKVPQEKIDQILQKIKSSIQNSIRNEFSSFTNSSSTAQDIQKRVEEFNEKISNIEPSNYLQLQDELYSILNDSMDLLYNLNRNSKNKSSLNSYSSYNRAFFEAQLGKY
ncbi:hypothetical protein [Halarcobacter ebronensis]|uniref:Uncharacterized protein n=1 Tax=Halarcobacter ebronensis TaxID=1462615 RepID=A0A4Q1AMF5_9BACT|nr:hypothetical protein [Halarcobacter ebronensis]QKF82208.1 hypothetical protein AEBR_1725 [Halarcobacter ebronensis]RXK03415.1 hypothetical protein CRV07_12095 [Halarcobacter ebronensis]